MALGFVMSAHAGSETTTFNVKITITDNCTITGLAASDVDFGSVVRSNTAPDAQGNLVVICSSGTPYTVGLNNGANYNGTLRTMILGTNQIPYALYKDAGRTDAWGSAGTALFSGTGTGNGVNLPVYGRISTGATNVPAGSYIDTVTATLSY
ncbi:spore coat protein U domain-containing protein [Diaphorobacter sp. HDW4B]|nr:spore coat protein U domain-containing protein [Diaphorobacter sp. HDW4B]